MENGQPMERLRCVVERITFQSDGYSVLKCAAKGFSDLVTVVGMMPDTHVGSVLTLGGQWKIDSRYGRQFQVASFEETLPATVYGMEKYLGSGLIKGIGPKYAADRPPVRGEHAGDHRERAGPPAGGSRHRAETGRKHQKGMDGAEGNQGYHALPAGA